MSHKFWACLIFVWLGNTLWASENVRWEFRSIMFYETEVMACNTEFFPVRLFLSGTIDNGKLTSARWERYAGSKSGSLAVSEEDLLHYHLYQDAYGKYWIEDFVAGPRHSAWAIMGTSSFDCRPGKIASIENENQGYLFDTDSLGVEVVVTYSNEIETSGFLADGRPFSVTLQWLQSRNEKEQE